MNWGLISKLSLLVSIGFVVWMLYPAGKCTAGGVDNEHEGVTEVHDWFYGHMEGEEMDPDERTFKENLKYCLGEHPVMKYPWQGMAAGGCFLGFIFFRWAAAKAYHKQVRKSQHMD